MNMNYKATGVGSFSDKLIQGLRFIINHDGPYLVHCVEGKDRTGFVIMVLECLGNASYNEIVNDYMITYENYYGINLENNPSKYNIIKNKNIDEMLKTIIGDDNINLETADYGFYIDKYLINIGLSEDELTALKNKLLK